MSKLFTVIGGGLFIATMMVLSWQFTLGLFLGLFLGAMCE